MVLMNLKSNVMVDEETIIQVKQPSESRWLRLLKNINKNIFHIADK
jgi:hypothetical protein